MSGPAKVRRLNLGEQLSPDDRSPGIRRYSKRQAARAMRRAARQNPEDAPRQRRWRGYSL